jgi:hypothetical protein
MRSAAPLSAITSARSARRAALGCLLLAGLGLAASLLLAPPIGLTLTLAGLRPALPLAAALLGLLAGGLALFARPPKPLAATENPREAILLAALQRSVTELRDVTGAQRSELVSLRDQYGDATREAMMVGARLAGVALDAETRLSAGVTRAEQALQRPADETASQLRAAADGMVQTIGDALAGASGQIEALGTFAGKLQHDAAALDSAGHEIATASASVVARLGEAVTRAGTVLAALPVVGATLTDAADVLAENGRQSLAAAARLQLETETLLSAAEDVAARIAAADHSAAELTQAAASLASVGDALAAEAVTNEAALRALPDATEALRSAAASLDEKAGTMSAALDRIEAAACNTAAAFAEGAAQAVQAATDLTGAAETLHGEATRLSAAGSEAAQAAASLEQNTAALHEAAADLPGLAAGLTEAAASLGEAGRQVADSSRSVADLLTADAVRGEALTLALSEGASSMQGDATALADAARRISEVGGAAVAAISEGVAQAAAVAQSLDAAGLGSAAATRQLEQQTSALVASTEAAATRIKTVADEAGTAFAGLSELGTGLSETALVLRRDVVALDGAGRQLALSGQAMAVRLTDDAARSEALLRALPKAMAGLSAATSTLQGDAGALEQAGRRLAAAGDVTAAAVGSAMAQAATVAQTLDASGRDAVAATLRLQQQTVSLQATTDIAATRIAGAADHAGALAAEAAVVLARESAALDAAGQRVSTLPAATAALVDAAASMGSRTEALEDAARRIANVSGEAVAAIGDTLAQSAHVAQALDVSGREAGAAARRLQHQSEAVQSATAEAAAQFERLGGLPDKFREAAARLEAAIARQDGASVTLQAAISRVHGAFEAVAQAQEQDAVAATLHHLGGVEQAALLLLQQAEALAEAVLGGRAPELPALLAERTPGLLAGLDTTIGRLRSAATALATASDAAAVRPVGAPAAAASA